MIKLIENYNHRNIFDGHDLEFYSTQIVDFGSIYKFKSLHKFSEFNNEFLDERDINQIISTFNCKRITPYPSYLSDEGLNYEISINKNQLLLISAGERQPGRYQIYLEGLWEIVTA